MSSSSGKKKVVNRKKPSSPKKSKKIIAKQVKQETLTEEEIEERRIEWENQRMTELGEKQFLTLWRLNNYMASAMHLSRKFNSTPKAEFTQQDCRILSIPSHICTRVRKRKPVRASGGNRNTNNKDKYIVHENDFIYFVNQNIYSFFRMLDRGIRDTCPVNICTQTLKKEDLPLLGQWATGYFLGDECYTEKQEAPIVPNPPVGYVWTQIEIDILKRLYQSPASAKQIANDTPNDIEAVNKALHKNKTLKREEYVKNRRGLGYYRADIPPTAAN